IRAVTADAIQLARQRSRAGERHRTRHRAGTDGRDPAGGSSRGAAGRADVGDGGGAVSQHAPPDEEATGDHGDGRREREPHRGRSAVGNPSQVPASADQESQFEVRTEAGGVMTATISSRLLAEIPLTFSQPRWFFPDEFRLFYQERTATWL